MTDAKEGAMCSFKFYLHVARPQHIILASLSTWVIAMLSNGPHYITTAKVVSPIVMALSVFGASFYHFGAANPMYTRKSESLSVDRMIRVSLIFLGLAGISTAVYITFRYLSSACRLIVTVDAIIIVAYAGLLSRHWLSKNILIAFVCVSPILLGWFAGHRLNPAVPYGIAVTFFAYLAREIVKDIQDRIANHGYRHTLPLCLGVVPARRIAAGVMMVALGVLGAFGLKLLDRAFYIFLPYLLVWKHFWEVAYTLMCCPGGNELKESKQILLGSCWLMLTFFLLIF